MTRALRAGAEKASRRYLFFALVRTAALNLSGETPERFAITAAIPQPGWRVTEVTHATLRKRE